MIIFNFKGVGVAIITIIVIAILIGLFKINIGISFIIGGLVGLYASFKIAGKNAGFFGQPSFFLIPTHVYAVLISIMGIVAYRQEPDLDINKLEAESQKEEQDIRKLLLDKDLDTLQANNQNTYAEIKSEVYAFIDSSSAIPFDIPNFPMVIKEDDLSAMFLIQIPELEHLKSDVRDNFVNALTMYLEKHPAFREKILYLLIKGSEEVFLTYSTVDGIEEISFMDSDEKQLQFYNN